MQGELSLLGNVVKDVAVHPPQEIAACQTLAQALYRAFMHSGDTQESIAEKVNVSPSYLSLILSGKRICPSRLVMDVVQVTRSAAPLQWMAAQIGADVYFDPMKVLIATKERELAALRARAA